MKRFASSLLVALTTFVGSFFAATQGSAVAYDCSCYSPGTTCCPATCCDAIDSCLGNDGCAGDCCECDCCGWYGLSEAMFWGRTSGTNRVTVIRVSGEAIPTPGTTVLTTGDRDFNFAPGLRVLVGRQLGGGQAIEASYFGIYDWNSTGTATGNNDLAIPGDLGLASLDFFAADRIDLLYRSQLNNVELNLVGSDGDFALLGGFRYLALNEDFIIRSTDVDTSTSDYRIQASNNLFGGQVGTRYRACCGAWGWDATAKAGVFGNAASQSQIVTDFPPGFILRTRREAADGQVAFVGDINLSATYQIDDFWALRAGYNLLWVEGVALAPAQLDFTDTATSGTTLHSTSGFFAHGVSFGVSAGW